MKASYSAALRTVCAVVCCGCCSTYSLCCGMLRLLLYVQFVLRYAAAAALRTVCAAVCCSCCSTYSLCCGMLRLLLYVQFVLRYATAAALWARTALLTVHHEGRLQNVIHGLVFNSLSKVRRKLCCHFGQNRADSKAFQNYDGGL
jgi:hypothetical protein